MYYKLVLLVLLTILTACGDWNIGTQGFPRNLSWADKDLDGDGVGENYLTPIKDQPCGDCYIYAATAAVEMRYQIDHQTSTTLNLSEQNIHNCLRISCDAAGDYRDILDYIRDYGVMLEEYSPTGKWRASCENCEASLQTTMDEVKMENIPFFRIKGYEPVEFFGDYFLKKDALVSSLQNGPVMIGIESWYGLKNDNGILYCIKRNWSYHMVVLVGYRNYGEVFLMKNSHGGDKLLRIAFDGGEDCGFADIAHQIPAGSTYISWGSGENFCYSTTDFDGDGIPNVHDNCPGLENSDQKNTDNDMFGDACDPCPKDKSPNGFYCLEKK